MDSFDETKNSQNLRSILISLMVSFTPGLICECEMIESCDMLSGLNCLDIENIDFEVEMVAARLKSGEGNIARDIANSSVCMSKWEDILINSIGKIF